MQVVLTLRNLQLAESTLTSFTAGFKLAWGMVVQFTETVLNLVKSSKLPQTAYFNFLHLWNK